MYLHVFVVHQPFRGGGGIGTVSIQHHQSSFQSMISCWCFSVLHLNTTHREEGFNISVGHFPATSFCPLTALSTSRNVNWPNTIRSIPDRLWAFEQNQNDDLLFQLATDWWFQLHKRGDIKTAMTILTQQSWIGSVLVAFKRHYATIRLPRAAHQHNSRNKSITSDDTR